MSEQLTPQRRAEIKRLTYTASAESQADLHRLIGAVNELLDALDTESQRTERDEAHSQLIAENEQPNIETRYTQAMVQVVDLNSALGEALKENERLKALHPILIEMLTQQAEQDAMAWHNGTLEPDKKSWMGAKLKHCLSHFGDGETSNNRRVDLIYKSVEEELTVSESAELEALQGRADAWVAGTLPTVEAALRVLISELEAAQEWRDIEKEKPPLEAMEVRFSSDVEVRLLLKFGDKEEGWEKGFCRWDYAMSCWDSLRKWTHWKPIGDNPTKESDG